ncbi:MAG: hypothetical protein LE180_02715 [Endomicrobium sp.]|uniref:hypothetical protein n=1 Tax=Candidatus Endomicrobiellum pyrsonymphae TaxID=1408203 RepID=UPI00357F33A0|nr:hypothetical protein [Endomicrobium sp.]
MKRFIFGAVLCFSLFGMVGNAHADFLRELGKVGEVVGGATVRFVVGGPVGTAAGAVAVVYAQNSK